MQSLQVADYLLDTYGRFVNPPSTFDVLSVCICDMFLTLLFSLVSRNIVNVPYQLRETVFDHPSDYEGETVLHIAIVNGDADRVRKLLAIGADVQARAWGPFFSSGPGVSRVVISGSHYTSPAELPQTREKPLRAAAVDFGEYPASFAASLGHLDILRLLISHGAQLKSVDSRGRCALHLAVVGCERGGAQSPLAARLPWLERAPCPRCPPAAIFSPYSCRLALFRPAPCLAATRPDGSIRCTG